MKVERIYLAGKITKNDWRHELVAGLRDWDNANKDEPYATDTDWPVLHGAIAGHDYTGPFFMGSAYRDHGDFAHGRSDHGNAIGEIESFGGHFQGESHPLNDNWRHEVVRRCLTAIRESTVVFAWIDAPDAYGTLVELGYAAALGVEIRIGLPSIWRYVEPCSERDFWFLEELPTISRCIATNTPMEAFARLVKTNTARVEYYNYIKSQEWREKATAAKQRAGGRCQVCNATGVQLDAHHRTYERLGRELATDITVLCRPCHELFERNKKAQRVGVHVTA